MSSQSIPARPSPARHDPARRSAGLRAATFWSVLFLTVVFLVVFEQGAATAGTPLLHEAFHDSRHLLGVPCH